MKWRWHLLMTASLLIGTAGFTPVHAQYHDDFQPQQSAERHEGMLVNAIPYRPILVKDRRAFQKKFLLIAERYVAKSSSTPMVFHDPHAFYCSGLVQQIYRENGIWIPAHSVAQQSNFGARIDKIDKVEVGDLLFFSGSPSDKVPAHVGLALDHGRIMHASGPKQQISVIKLNDELRNHFMFATRLVSSV